MKMEDTEIAGQELLSEEERREIRRQRRRKNQLIARVSMVLVFVIVLIGAFWGASILKSALREEQKQEEIVFTEEESIDGLQETEDNAQENSIDRLPEEEVVFDEKQVLDEVVESVISEMTLEEKVAGIFLVRPEDITGVDVAVQAGDGTKKALEEYPVAGLVYFAQNIKSEDQIKEMITNTTSYSKYPLFLAIDEEGGEVAQLANTLKVEEVPPMAEIGQTHEPQKAKEAMVSIGSYLKEYGFNLNFAPVADILDEQEKGIFKSRSFGKDASLVANMVSYALEGLKETDITACIRHFPGMGDGVEDTHEEMSVINKTKEQLYEKELLPFISAIQSGAEMIMVGHASYPQIIGDNTPASLSKEIITDLLREELEYNGIVITDALNMAAVVEYYSADEAAVKALKAGADLLLMPEEFSLAYEGVLNAVKEGTISEERINDCLKRIYRIKYRNSVGEE